MRKLINSTYISLDGVIENPHHWPPSSGKDDGTGGKIQTDLLLSCDAVLMGRRTYDGFAPVWMTKSGDPLSDRMNSIKKYVFSTTLTDPKWANTTVLDGDVATEVAKLKEQPGENIVQYGFGQVSQALLDNGLIDELRLWVHPLIVGDAQPRDLLFRQGSQALFDHADTTTLANGIVVLSYTLRQV
ncbi:dihydrofolate reductase family protein [Actinokineospora sp.]|uniref:dihydrofolate reductase family protein n=1 Tax=Actinokineospora sp. TaxID=1872133 RepID=UPI003D6BF3E3